MREGLSLRIMKDSDIDFMKDWLYQDYVAKWYEHPSSWLNEILHRTDVFFWIHHFIVECKGVPIGFCQYYEYSQSGEDWHDNIELEGTYSIDYLLGNRKYLGQGFGKEMVHLLIEEISKQEGAKRIIVKPEEDNKASCNTLRSAGFSYETEKELYLYRLKSLTKGSDS